MKYLWLNKVLNRRGKLWTCFRNVKAGVESHLVTKMSKFFTFFNWEITRLIQFHDCLFIEPRISWWSETQTILTCNSHWPVCNPAKLNSYQFPLCHVASQLDVVTLSSNIFPSRTIQNNCGNFFNLDSRFVKAGRRLGPVYIEVGVG